MHFLVTECNLHRIKPLNVTISTAAVHTVPCFVYLHFQVIYTWKSEIRGRMDVSLLIRVCCHLLSNE